MKANESIETHEKVPVTEAIVNIARYVNKYGDQSIRAFKIGASDMLQVLGLDSVIDSKYEYCRAYIGMESNNDFKLYLTPVRVTEGGFFDVFLPDGTTVPTEESYVLDLIAPCPNSCDPNSPLNVKI